MAVAAAVALVFLVFKEPSLRPALKLALGAAPGVVGLIAYNGIMFNSWGPSNGHELRGNISLRLRDLPFNVAGTLFDPVCGLVFFYPVVLVALAGAPRAWRRAASWERAGAVGGMALLLTQLSLDTYTGGDGFFGPRLLIEPLVLSGPFLARSIYLSGRSHGMRPVYLALLMGGLVHSVGGIAFHQFNGW
jgi:hypothetical protein